MTALPPPPAQVDWLLQNDQKLGKEGAESDAYRRLLGEFGCEALLGDSAQKICIVRPHPSDKNKDVARVGHPNCIAIHKGRINIFCMARATPHSIRLATACVHAIVTLSAAA
jgi:hypothetical protein